MRPLILLLGSVALFSCQSQQTDMTALVQGIQDLEAKHMALSDGFTQIAQKSIDASGQKEILLQRLSEDRSQFGAVSQGLIRLAGTLGRVDYASLYNAISSTIWQIRFPGQPAPTYPAYYSVDVNR